MIIDVGPKPADVTLSWENLYAYNRKILDPESNRYFFVAEPVKLKVAGLPRTFNVKLPLHPEKPEKGSRFHKITPTGLDKTAEFWIAMKDSASMEPNKVIRLMELFNIRVEKASKDNVEAVFVSESYEDVRKVKAQLIQWIPIGQDYLCEVVMNDGTRTTGFAEDACKELKPPSVIQFERFGFVRADEVAPDKLTVYYAHK
jgi:glutamyl-tRNA synthetase